ncbi:hypothetical protein PNA2_0047 [Pyrococcus sp. NA2]|uniref:DUF3213 domain-containing protein n=1 Tax=Pyrococcus sp. (strain NA2) TaxID=342949 RepID=UPI000209AD1E|nr:DUF3213 domain-containing protein [Pyrococcus sp. NA2]AEC50964.1 hypothetical protein PNA2_0047 [Pyrococcus sp. NA2]
MKEIVMKLNNSITHEEAMAVQYELSKEDAVYRAFINPYARMAKIIFDENKKETKDLLSLLEKFKPEIIEERSITVDDVIERSLSWKNIIKR